MRGRPPKLPEERKTSSIKIPLTDEEKAIIEQAARSQDARPVTWAREVLLRAASRRKSN